MTRREFLRGLEEALQMDVPESVIRDQLRYYDQYISDELAKGRSEREVVEELGDPRLIAKTIEEATEAGGISGVSDGDYREETDGYGQTGAYGQPSGGAQQGGRTYTEDGRPADSGESGPFGGHRGTVFQTNGTMGCILATVILVAVLSLIGAIFTALAPILIPVVIVLVILWMLKGMMNR